MKNLTSFIFSCLLLILLSKEAILSPIEPFNNQKDKTQKKYLKELENDFDPSYQDISDEIHLSKRVNSKYYRTVVDSIMDWISHQKKVSKQGLRDNQHWYIQFGK